MADPDTVRPPETQNHLSKELHGLLGGFDAEDPRDLELLRRLVDRLGEAALPELSDRMIRPTSSRGLRRAILAEVGRNPELGWIPLLTRALMHEPDPLLFEEGCRAMVQLGSEEAADALRLIGKQRVEEGFAAVLERKLAWLESHMPFSYHFRDLLLGNGQPRLAKAAAERLGTLSQPSHLEELRFACLHPDPLTARLAHRVLGAMPFPEAAEALVHSFREVRGELAADARLRNLLDRARKAGDKVAQVLLGALEEEAGPEGREAVEGLRKAHEAQQEDLSPQFTRLRERAPRMDSRLMQVAELALHGRKWSAPAAEFLQTARTTQARLVGILDEAGEGVAFHARRGDLDPDTALGLLEGAFREELAGEGLARAYASLIPPEDEVRLAQIHACTVQGQRRAAMEVLSGLGDPRLKPFFLLATEDPIVDNAQFAVKVLGQLPGGFELGMDLLASGRPDQVEKALILFGANRMKAAVSRVLDLVRETEREDLLLRGLETLGELGCTEVIEPLVELIRGGQSPRVLAGLVQAIARLGSPEGVKSLLMKVPELRQPELLLLTLDAVASVHGGPECPLPADLRPQLDLVLAAAWAEGDAFRARAAPLAAAVFTEEVTHYRKLRESIEELLAQQRKHPSLPRERFQQLVGVVRDLDRRLGAIEDQVKLEEGFSARIEALGASQWRDAQALTALVTQLTGGAAYLGPAARARLAERIRLPLESPAGLAPAALEQVFRLAVCAREGSLAPLLQGFRRRINPGSHLGRELQATLEALGAADFPPEPARDLLLLEPNGFFRRRLAQGLQGWNLREAQDREEAEGLLRVRPVDYLVSEWTDGQGPLEAWFREAWIGHRIAGVLVVASDRAAERALGEPWCRGILLKPFGPEALLAFLPRPE